MRLINTTTLALEEYFGDQIPLYAILSHTWEKNEVNFQEWTSGIDLSWKKGYQKILMTCELAKKHGFGYIWVDTCCIDKTSSSELSEAINSMFRWYKSARVCYAYLSDVLALPGVPLPVDSSSLQDILSLEPVHESAKSELESIGFLGSRWFMRGWTLQELLAPEFLVFYSRDWTVLGTKRSLCSIVSAVTRIDARYLWLENYQVSYSEYRRQTDLHRTARALPVSKASVAERLSWLFERETTREEDMAYCMMGIFNLNMPLLYGEGSKAFTRLQEEILKVSDDYTLFCWTFGAPYDHGSALATLPSGFATAGGLCQAARTTASPYIMTNAGLYIALPLLSCWEPSCFIGILPVTLEDGRGPLGLPLGGDMRTGRLFRRSYPDTPICLAKQLAANDASRFFISENHYQPPARYDDAEAAAIATAVMSPFFAETRTPLYAPLAEVLLTFEPRSELVEIDTYPQHRFSESRSCLAVSRDPRSVPKFASPFKVGGSEGVAVRITLNNRESKYFMVCLSIVPSDQGSEGRLWHAWRLDPQVGNRLLPLSPVPSTAEDAVYSPGRDCLPGVAEIRKGIADPDYARSTAFSRDLDGFSVAVAEDDTILGDTIFCHMHVNWNPTEEQPAAPEKLEVNPWMAF